VSRQTLYRYFASKDALIEGLIEHLKRLLEVALIQAMEDNPTLEGRLKAVSAANLKAEEMHKMTVLLRAEPGFMLRFLRAHADDFSVILEDAFAPYFDEAEIRSGVAVDRAMVAELVTRIRISLFLAPRPDKETFAHAAISALIRGVLQDPSSWAVEPATAQRTLRK
jgi:AcrR family transcriptional regulator